MNQKPTQSAPQPVIKETIQISSSARTALQEANETTAQTAKEAMVRGVGFTSFSVTLLAFVFVFSLVSYLQAAFDTPRQLLIRQAVDENELVTLKGNSRPEANPANDRGRVADDFQMEHMLLQLQRSTKQEQVIKEFIDQLYDPASPNFHRWLTAQKFRETFGLAEEDLNAITTWLQTHGFRVNMVYPSGMVIDFSGSAGQVREAFKTEIHHLEVNGVKHITNMGDPQIPAALAPAVAGIVSLHDFVPRPMHKFRRDYTFTSGQETYRVVAPADLATIYNINPLFSTGISGQGQTIVVIEDSNVYSTSDWTTFRNTFGLSGYVSGTFTQLHPSPLSGANNCSDPGVNDDDGEAILDAEWASATAPSAAIELASCASTSTTFGGLIALLNLINEGSPPAIVSISYGECEAVNGASANAAYNAAYQQAAAEGVSVFVAAGDEGGASCDANVTQATHGIGVSGLASTPYNVAVGGTDFGDTYAGTNTTYWNGANTSTYGSARSYIPEIPWNDSCASVLIASYVSGSGITYGSSGFCNSHAGQEFLGVVSGSGGPSGCASGVPSIGGVVSGTCEGYRKPSWQSGIVGIPNDSVRDIPDISLFAGNGLWGHYYPFCWSDTSIGGALCTGAPSSWSGAGGTSFSSPIMAGIQALVNQHTGESQGNPNPVYYNIAASEYGTTGSASCNSTNQNGEANSCIFYDVTQGDMDVNCKGSSNCYLPSGRNGVLSTSNSSYSKAYGATTGWDFATGIGTVNAYNLVNSPLWLKSTTPLLYASFTGGGLWQWNGTAWSQVNAVGPNNMVASDSILYGDFGAGGLWQWNGTAWSQVNAVSPTSMAASGSLLYGNFIGNGIWVYNGTTWSQVNAVSPTSMAASGSLLYGNFTGNGIWMYNGTSWSQLTPGNPTSMAASGSLLYGNFIGNGIWVYNGTSWSQLTPGNPTSMAASGSLLYGNFIGNGIWVYNGTTWSQVNAVAPTTMVASGSILYSNFGSGGLWQWNGTAWSQINAVSPTSMVTGP